MDKKIKVIAYIRVNKIEQLETGSGVHKQAWAIQQCCKEKGWELIHQYIDIGKSANSDKRPMFQEMIAAVKAPDKDFSKIIIYRLDRFSRNLFDFYKYLSVLKGNGVSLYSVSENTELPDNFLTEDIFSVIKSHPPNSSRNINFSAKKKGHKRNGQRN